MNTMRRSRRYDEPKMPTRPSATTTAITMSIVRSGTSPSHMTARMPTTQIMAVPRSDCGPKMMSTGASTSRPTSAKNTHTEYCPSRKSENSRAATSTSAIFANSEAWRLADPIMSQRRAPHSSSPTPATAVTTSSANATAQMAHTALLRQNATGTSFQMIAAMTTPATANLIWLRVSPIGSTASLPAFARVMTAEVE